MSLEEFRDRVGTESTGNREVPRNRPVRSSARNLALDPEADQADETEDGGQLKPTDTGQRRWSASDDKFWGCSSTYEVLPSGLYKPRSNPDIGVFLEKQIIDTDELLVLPDSVSKDVLNEIERFWRLKNEFDKRGFIHKRGILMWGDPGSGKTATIQLMIRNIVSEGGIALFAGHPQLTVNALQMIRRIEPERKIIVVLEDFESLIFEYGDQEYLAMLDGESQISNVAFVATTNYPERLDKRFVDRPSRFDTIVKVSMPNEEARRYYLKNKEPSLEGDELERWVELSEGLGISHMKEMIISNRCYGMDIEEVVDRLKNMRDRQLSSMDALDKDKVATGFVANG